MQWQTGDDKCRRKKKKSSGKVKKWPVSPNKKKRVNDSFKKFFSFSSENVSNIIKFGVSQRWWDKLTTNQPSSLKCIADLRLLLIYTISRGDYENEWTRYLTFLITFLLPVKDRFANGGRLCDNLL